jgi:hypothetical protein
MTWIAPLGSCVLGTAMLDRAYFLVQFGRA